MDQVGFPSPWGASAANEDASRLAGCLMSCILSCAASNDLFAEKSFVMLHIGMAANMSALEQLNVFLNEDNPMLTVKAKGKQSVDDLIKRFHDLCRGVAVVLLRANTPSPDEAGLRALTDQQLVQKLGPRHLAAVIRGERHKWLKPRAVLYLEELETLAIDVMLHTYVFRLAELQMSRTKATPGAFEEELAVRAFAQRFVAIRQKESEKRQADHEKRYRLREMSDSSETCSIASSNKETSRDDDASKRCPSEAGSETKTVVVEEDPPATPAPSFPPESPLVKTKAEAIHIQPPIVSNAVETSQGVPQSLMKDARGPHPVKPGFFKKHLTYLRHRAWIIFSRDAAALRTLNYHGEPPLIEAWVMNNRDAYTFQHQESNATLLKEIRQHVRSGIDTVCDAAFQLTVQERISLERTRAKASVADLRRRRCILVCACNSSCRSSQHNNIQHHTVYFVLGERLDCVRIRDPQGVEFLVPVGEKCFWTDVKTAYLAQGLKNPPWQHAISSGFYKLVAEDGAVIFHGSSSRPLRAGCTYNLVIQPPRLPAGPVSVGCNRSHPAWEACPPPVYPQWFGHPRHPAAPQHLRGRVSVNSVSDSSSDDEDDGEVTWEIVKELGFEDREPASTATLSELLATCTNAPDTEFDADVSDSVLGPMPVDASDTSSGSGSTVD